MFSWIKTNHSGTTCTTALCFSRKVTESNIFSTNYNTLVILMPRTRPFLAKKESFKTTYPLKEIRKKRININGKEGERFKPVRDKHADRMRFTTNHNRDSVMINIIFLHPTNNSHSLCKCCTNKTTRPLRIIQITTQKNDSKRQHYEIVKIFPRVTVTWFHY